MLILLVTSSPGRYSNKSKIKSQINIAHTSMHAYLDTHSVRKNPVQPLRYASIVRTCHIQCNFLVHNVQLLPLKLYSHEQNKWHAEEWRIRQCWIYGGAQLLYNIECTVYASSLGDNNILYMLVRYNIVHIVANQTRLVRVYTSMFQGFLWFVKTTIKSAFFRFE